MNNQNKNLNKKSLREFGLITGGILVGIFGLLLPWLLEHEFPVWPWIIAGVLWVLAILLPMSLDPVYRAWMKIGLVLAWINTRIILGIMFYLIFLPVGLVLRLAGKDAMNRKLSKTQDTYRIIHPVPPKNHVEKPY